MNQLNSLILEGTITDVKVDGNVCAFTLATNHVFYKNVVGENDTETSYIECKTFGSMSAFCENILEVNKIARIVGRITQERWEDSTGKTCSKIYVACEHVEIR